MVVSKRVGLNESLTWCQARMRPWHSHAATFWLDSFSGSWFLAPSGGCSVRSAVLGCSRGSERSTLVVSPVPCLFVPAGRAMWKKKNLHCLSRPVRVKQAASTMLPPAPHPACAMSLPSLFLSSISNTVDFCPRLPHPAPSSSDLVSA